MASEDHDFEEISYFNLFGEKYTWETDQKGAVGRMDPKSIKAVLDAMPGHVEVFRKAYLEHDSLAAAVRYYVNELFGDEGLVVIDGDDKAFKEKFSTVIKDELKNQSSFNRVNEDTNTLTKLGYKPQISAREINLFYLDDGVRERIVKEGDTYRVINTDLSFTESEMMDLVDKDPLRFSPNVILRPLYQEILLPNLAYVGGPAEVVYWLQLKGMFDHYKITFPILLPRNFVLYTEASTSRKISKTDIEVQELFKPVNVLVDDLVKESSQNHLELEAEQKAIASLFADIQKKALKIDQTLESLVGAEAKRAEKSLTKIEQKMVKAEKRHYDDHIRKLEDLKTHLFPGGGPQERSLNYLNFQLGDDQFIMKIKGGLDPFDLRYHIILDDSE
jgi:bacillithiol biosynthesis cysteine-adding enzyme BshC